MAKTQYTLKAVPIWAEQVPQDLASILAMATEWGAEVTVAADGAVTVKLSFGATAKPGWWLLDKGGGDRGCCTNDEFVASFESVTVGEPTGEVNSVASHPVTP